MNNRIRREIEQSGHKRILLEENSCSNFGRIILFMLIVENNDVDMSEVNETKTDNNNNNEQKKTQMIKRRSLPRDNCRAFW